MPSTRTGASVRNTKDRPGARDSRLARQPAQANTTTAAGHATTVGSSDANSEQAASTPSNTSAPDTQREGRQSIRASMTLAGRKCADALDERVEFGIAGGLIAHEPAPELIVLAFQQP